MATGAMIALSLLSAAVSHSQARSAARSQREARNVQSASQRIEGAREARKLARQARIRKAQLRQSAENTGTGTGSGVSGATSSITSQTGAGLSFLEGKAVAASAVSGHLQNAADAQFRGQVAKGVGDLFFQAAGGAEGIAGYFNSKGSTTTAGGATSADFGQFAPVSPQPQMLA